MGVERLKLYSGHKIDLFCVCSDLEDENYLKSKGVKYCTYPNTVLSEKFDYGFKQALKLEFDYLLRLGSDDLLDHNIFNLYYNDLMSKGVHYFGLKTIGCVDSSNLDSCVYKYNHHRNDMILGGGSMMSRWLCEQFKDATLYNRKKINRGLDFASETEIKKHTQLTPVKTNKPHLIDVKSTINIWAYKYVSNRMPKISYEDLTTFISIEEDMYLRRLSFKCVAVIPIKGRLPLLKHTIERLYKKNGVFKVICVGETEDEKNLVESCGAEFINHENKPLGKKWNAGFMEAKKYNPDCCLFVGSSDWVSDNWLPYCSQYLREYDMIGKPDFYLLDYGRRLRVCHWSGYTDKRRLNEPIGIGRVLSKRILEKMNWKPMDDKLDSSLDWSMYQKVILYSGRIKMINNDEIKSLSLSTSQWENKHKFEDHWSGKLPSKRLYENLLKEFPEAYELH